MAHIGIECFAASDAEDNPSQDHEAMQTIAEKKGDSLPGIKGGKDLRIVDNGPYSEATEHQEPDHHDRAEHGADACRAIPLDNEQDDQHQTSERHDITGGGIRGHIESFNGRQHRNGRRNNAIAIEQRRPESGEKGEQRPLFSTYLQPLEHGEQRENPAFTLVVSLHDKDDIFQADNQHQRPEDQRQNAEDIGGGRCDPVGAGETLLDGVKRAGADIAVNNPQSRHGQERQFFSCGMMKRLFPVAYERRPPAC